MFQVLANLGEDGLPFLERRLPGRFARCLAGNFVVANPGAVLPFEAKASPCERVIGIEVDYPRQMCPLLVRQLALGAPVGELQLSVDGVAALVSLAFIRGQLLRELAVLENLLMLLPAVFVVAHIAPLPEGRAELR